MSAAESQKHRRQIMQNAQLCRVQKLQGKNLFKIKNYGLCKVINATCKIIKGFSYLNLFFSYWQSFKTQISIFEFSSNCLLCCLLLSPESSQIILGTKSYTGSNILKGNCSFNSVEVSDQLGATYPLYPQNLLQNISIEMMA